MKKNTLKSIILLTILIGFGSYLFLYCYSIKAADLSDSRDISREGTVSRDTELNINRDTDVNRGSGIDRNPEDQESPHDRESVLCDPKFGGDPKNCITPTEVMPTPTIHYGTPTPTPPTGGEGNVTPTPTPTNSAENPTPTPGPSSSNNPGGDGGGGGQGSPGETIGQVKSLSFTGGDNKLKFFFMLSGVVCFMSGLILIKPSKRI